MDKIKKSIKCKDCEAIFGYEFTKDELKDYQNNDFSILCDECSKAVCDDFDRMKERGFKQEDMVNWMMGYPKGKYI